MKVETWIKKFLWYDILHNQDTKHFRISFGQNTDRAPSMRIYWSNLKTLDYRGTGVNCELRIGYAHLYSCEIHCKHIVTDTNDTVDYSNIF